MTRQIQAAESDLHFMRLALRLARRGLGRTSPNPMVGAVLVREGRVIGQGWHRRAGEPHAEVEAIRNAGKRGNRTRCATLYVTLEPCSTSGRTPPCTDAIQAAGIRRVVAAATDPNPKHAGRAFRILRRAGVGVLAGIQAQEAARLNEAFNHWIVHRTPFVTAKIAMTLDGKIATPAGESRWITGEAARRFAMGLRHEADAILVGVNTILADDPSLTARYPDSDGPKPDLRRIVLDTRARTPLTSRVVTDQHAVMTTIVVGRSAPASRVSALAKRVRVLVAPSSKPGRANRQPGIALPWLLKVLGRENVTSLLVEGGGEVNTSFLMGGLTHRIAFFYAPKILGGRNARKAVAGNGARQIQETLALRRVEWRRLDQDLLLTARLQKG